MPDTTIIYDDGKNSYGISKKYILIFEGEMYRLNGESIPGVCKVVDKSENQGTRKVPYHNYSVKIKEGATLAVWLPPRNKLLPVTYWEEAYNFIDRIAAAPDIAAATFYYDPYTEGRNIKRSVGVGVSLEIFKKFFRENYPHEAARLDYAEAPV